MKTKSRLIQAVGLSALLFASVPAGASQGSGKIAQLRLENGGTLYKVKLDTNTASMPSCAKNTGYYYATASAEIGRLLALAQANERRVQIVGSGDCDRNINQGKNAERIKTVTVY